MGHCLSIVVENNFIQNERLCRCCRFPCCRRQCRRSSTCWCSSRRCSTRSWQDSRPCPAHDSASIANHRLGGNFAYAVQTAEAFAEVTPKIAHQTIPVAEHTHVYQPAAIRTIQPAPIITKTFSASPVLAQKP